MKAYENFDSTSALPFSDLVPNFNVSLGSQNGTMPKPDCWATGQHNPRSKNEHYRNLLPREAVRQITVVLSDLWFAPADKLRLYRDLKKDLVKAFKKKREGSVNSIQVAQSLSAESAVELSEKPVVHGVHQEQHVFFAVLLARQDFTSKDDSTGLRYLASSSLSAPSDRLFLLPAYACISIWTILPP